MPATARGGPCRITISSGVGMFGSVATFGVGSRVICEMAIFYGLRCDLK
jgi:hypothetical protein